MEIFTGKNFLKAGMFYCFIMGFLLVSSLDIFRMYLELNYHISNSTTNGRSSMSLKLANNCSSMLFCILVYWLGFLPYIIAFMIGKNRGLRG
jgi:ascorbate-specific PTS system EIIC-type component UlaA